ncbi:MAG: TrkH family potassium uptake protein [Gammaproteobacteria bacterium]
MLGVAHVLGSLLALFGITFVLPLITSLIMGDGKELAFIIAAAVSSGAGLLISLATRGHARELKPRDGFLLATLSWVLMSASATIPLLMVIPDLSFTDAYFEAMSGLTTTGSTVLTGLDSLPPSINLWRHALHWFGGLGIIVLAVAVLPLLGIGGMQLYKAESPGPVKDEKLTPRITETAKSLWVVYTFMTLFGIVALRVAGMSWFDAICHAFSAMGLGGFSTHDASIGYFNSVSIELVLTLLMVAASLNFARHFVALRRLTFRPYLHDPEAKAIAMVLAFSVIFIALLLTFSGTYPSFFTSLRYSLFNVVSMATTTGFVSQDFEQWPAFAPIWMLFLTCIVCSTGSTGGGIKMFRTLLLARQAGRELKLLVHPNAVWPVRIGGRPVPDRVASSVLAFIFLYFMTVVSLTFALLLTGLNFDSSFSAVVASVNNAGPGLEAVGPIRNYKDLTDAQTWICTIAMLIGRLEVFSVLVLFTPTFWRK